MNALQKDIPKTVDKKITVKTSRFGEIVVDKSRIISLVSPLLGFPEANRFILRPHSEESPFMWLQSLDNPDLAFVVIAASLLDLDYSPQIPQQVAAELKIKSDKDRDLLLILTIPKDKPQEMTANLLGPLVVSSKQRLAAQIVLDPQKYDPCWPLFRQNKRDTA